MVDSNKETNLKASHELMQKSNSPFADISDTL